MKIRAFITHKLSEKYSDCQDRFHINQDSRILAVSDGMSQSIFPDIWADLLSEQYAKNGHCDEADRQILCDDWLQQVESYRDLQKLAGKQTWKLDNCLAERKGAGATICGVKFKNATDWEGDVLGDSCIIEVDKNQGKAKIYSSEEKAFDSYPDFYDSYPDKKGRGIIKSFTGSINPDKVLLLVSDPFSEFFYANKDDCKTLIDQILKINNHREFCQLVEDWRWNGMHNDDSTLCVIEFDGDLSFNIITQDDISQMMEEEHLISEKTGESFPNDEKVSESIKPCAEKESSTCDLSYIIIEISKIIDEIFPSRNLQQRGKGKGKNHDREKKNVEKLKMKIRDFLASIKNV